MKIIIPAYQPDLRMIQLISDIKAESSYEIVIVNDGSGSKYTPVFEKAVEAGCTVLIHEENKGKGAALKTAFTYLLENNSNDGMICADCDGQHTWADIKKIAEAIGEKPTSIVLGCRKFIGNVPLKSRFGNKITKAVFALTTGNKIDDTQTGLRGFSSSMLPWLVGLKGSRYEYEMNQLLEAKKAGYNFHCIPIETIYENNNESSHFHPIRDSIRIYLPILKFSLSSIICGMLDFIMLFLFKGIFGNLLLSVVAARVISSLCNYFLNRHLVFDANTNRKLATLIEYYLLAAVILGCNYLIISFLNETLGISLIISKLLTEAILFTVSYIVQHKIIFKKNPVPADQQQHSGARGLRAWSLRLYRRRRRLSAQPGADGERRVRVGSERAGTTRRRDDDQPLDAGPGSVPAGGHIDLRDLGRIHGQLRDHQRRAVCVGLQLLR
jgi:glycosyltransferase involved in cell wall biosynthesis